MTPEQAQVVVQLYCQDAAAEAPTTRKVIAAVPAAKGAFAPHPTSTSALDLAWHIASSEVWFLNGVAAGNFPMEENKRPDSVQTPADVLAWYDSHFGPALEAARNISPELAAREIDFFGVVKLPNALYLGFMIKHSVHHRGQLSAYLRPMGAKVPSIYGGSADEPFEAAAATA
ncbi:MAG: DinB family protein [Bryobacterales bacterium]|nr:DinB family protein [Bryobacterales bacterium]